MQQTLWGDEIPQPEKKSGTSHTTLPTVIHTAQDCPIFGHDWQTIAKSSEKKCLACGDNRLLSSLRHLTHRNTRNLFTVHNIRHCQKAR